MDISIPNLAGMYSKPRGRSTALMLILVGMFLAYPACPEVLAEEAVETDQRLTKEFDMALTDFREKIDASELKEEVAAVESQPEQIVPKRRTFNFEPKRRKKEPSIVRKAPVKKEQPATVSSQEKQVAESKDVPESRDTIVSKIDAAVKDAERKLKTQRILAEAKRTLEVTKPKALQEEVPPETKTLAKEASTVYRDRSNYLEAYELSEQALSLDPENREAKEVKRRIKDDLDERLTDILDYDEAYTPPEGALAYKVAMSDDLLTIREVEDIAVKNSIQLESLKRRIEGSKRKLFEAKRAMFPTVEGEISSSGGIIINAYTGESFKLNLTQPLYRGGELLFTVKQAEAGLESDRLKYEKERIDIIYQVGEAYRNVVEATYNLNYQSDLYEDVTTHKERNEKAFEQRLIPEIQYLEVLSIYYQVGNAEEGGKISLQSANLTLHQLMAVDLKVSAPVDLSLEFSPIKLELDPFLRMVRHNNLDIKIKEMSAKTAYYGAKVFQAQKMPQVNLRGGVGLSGERFVQSNTGFGDQGPNVDLENEHFIGIEVKMPWGPNQASYEFQRRFFAPTVSSFQGSEDFRHVLRLGILNKLASLTDEEIAKADYLKAKAELQKEEADQIISARQAYFDYKGALLQLETSRSKIRYREKQIKVLEHTTKIEESEVSDLLNEMVTLAEDYYSRVTSITGAKNALSKMNRIIGIERYYHSES